MKVIFLDIDGVLMTENHLGELNALGKPMSINGSHIFDPACVENLVRIINATDAKVVLSSAWRFMGRDVFMKLWKDRNMPGEVIDFTPKNRTGRRGAEIWEWLNNAPLNGMKVESFVIIDDEVSDMLVEQTDRIIHTTFKFGLCGEDVTPAIEILNTPIKNMFEDEA